jgi:hypothetical protein
MLGREQEWVRPIRISGIRREMTIFFTKISGRRTTSKYSDRGIIGEHY